MRRQLRRLTHVTAPVATIVAVPIVFYIVIQGLTWFVAGIARELDDPSIVEPFLRMRVLAPTIAAIGIAAYRIFAHHPILHSEYRRWLEQTPWTPKKPLPLGSIQPSWLEPMLLAFLCWMASGVGFEQTIAPLVCFVTALLIVSCVIVGMTRQRTVLFGLLFGIGLAIRLAYDVVPSLVVLVALCPLARVGLRESLDPRRWPALPTEPQSPVRAREKKQTRLGWPFVLLGPKASPQRLSNADSVAISLLIGWYGYCWLSHPAQEDGRGLVYLMIVIGSIVRLFTYLVGHLPPISVFGRIATGRWIVPGYDKIFVSPLSTLAVLVVGEVAVLLFPIPINFGAPIIFATCCFLLTGLGPSLRNWELTGSHRITPFGHINKASGYIEV